MGGVPCSVCYVYTAIGHLTRLSLNPTSVNYHSDPANMEVTGRITKTSRLFQFLIKICFIPVSVKSEEIVFKVFSLKMLVYILSAVLWIIFTQIMMFVFMKQEDFDRFFSEVTSYILKHSLNNFFSKVCLRGSV